MAATSAEAQKSMAGIENCKKQVDESVAKAPGGLSSQTLKEFTESLRKEDQVVVEAFLSQQGNIINDVDVQDLVTEYFGASLETLQFLNELEHCLRVLDLSHTYLVVAIKKYENEKFDACLESLKKFKAHGDPFEEKFFPMFRKLHERQEALLAKVKEMQVEAEKKKEEAESSSCSWWGHFFGIVAVAATAVTVVCAAVVAVEVAADVAVAVEVADVAVAGEVADVAVEVADVAVAGAVADVAGEVKDVAGAGAVADVAGEVKDVAGAVAGVAGGVADVAGAVAGVAGGVADVAGAVALTSKLVLKILNAQTEEERSKNREKLKTIILRFTYTTCIIHELNSIGIFAETLERQIVSLKENADESLLDPEALDRIFELVKIQTNVFRDDISQLIDHALECKVDILKGRDDVAKLIQKFT